MPTRTWDSQTWHIAQTAMIVEIEMTLENDLSLEGT